MNPLPDEKSRGFHAIRWTDEDEVHFVAMRTSWPSPNEDWQLVGDTRYFSRSEILDLIGTAFVETWRWDA